MGIAKFARPDCAVITACAFDETTIDHHRFVFVRAKQGSKISLGFSIGFLRIPGTHPGYRKKKLFRPRNVFLLVAGLVGHGIDQHHGLALVNHFFQFGRSQQFIAAGLGIAGQLDGFNFLGRFEEELSLQQRRVQLARTTLARNEQLAAAGFVAPAQVQTKQEELIDADGRLQSLERARLALQHDLQALQGERSALSAQLQTDLSQIERSRSSLEQEMSENAARQSTVVTAPFDGTVTALNLKLGQSVQSGQTLVTLVPVSGGTPGSGPQQLAVQAPLQAQLFAPSRTAGFVRPGQTVYLRYDAYPYQKFGLHTGHITSVSATPFAPSELPANLAQQLVAQSGSNEALYRINVQLDEQSIQAYGEPVALKAGLTLEADVLQKRRKVWEWVLEPVLAARQQMKVLGAVSKAVSAGI
mgnify:CR=1 FL=1